MDDLEILELYNRADGVSIAVGNLEKGYYYKDSNLLKHDIYNDFEEWRVLSEEEVPLVMLDVKKEITWGLIRYYLEILQYFNTDSLSMTLYVGIKEQGVIYDLKKGLVKDEITNRCKPVPPEKLTNEMKGLLVVAINNLTEIGNDTVVNSCSE